MEETKREERRNWRLEKPSDKKTKTKYMVKKGGREGWIKKGGEKEKKRERYLVKLEDA